MIGNLYITDYPRQLGFILLRVVQDHSAGIPLKRGWRYNIYPPINIYDWLGEKGLIVMSMLCKV